MRTESTRFILIGRNRLVFQGAMGCAVPLLLAAASSAAAQQQTSTAARTARMTQPSDNNLEIVTVTGIRAAIEDAISRKKNADQIVEAISAEDIGKLPDTSIAESISRLPGVTSQRANGRASAISVRGTDPGFATALLNGREQVSTGDNRSVEFDQYPSELLSTVVVYKTPDASLVGQGLSGTIDLQTTRPLEYRKRAVAVNFRGERNSQSDLGSDSTANGYRFSFSYIDQFFDNTLGVSLGAARLFSPIDSEETGTYQWSNNTPGMPGVYSAQGWKMLAGTGKERRDGTLATVEWRPWETFTSTLDLYYTKSDRRNDRRSLEVNTGGYPAALGYTNPTVVDNSLVAASFTNANPLARNFLYTRRDNIFAGGWNNKFTADRWTVVSDLSYSRARRDERQLETQAQIFPQTFDAGSFSIPSDSMPRFVFNRNYSNASVEIGPTIYGPAYLKFPQVNDELKSARLDITRDLEGLVSSVTVGFNYDDRRKDKAQPETGASTKGGGWYPISGSLLTAPTNLSFSGTPSTIAYDVPGVLATYFSPFTPSDNSASYLVQKKWSVREKVATGYGKLNLNRELSSSVALRGNIGAQVVRTDQGSDAQYWDNTVNTAKPVHDGKTYTDVLPAMNLAFILPSQQVVRLGIARELARPRMDQLTAGFDFNVDKTSTRPSATGGNPKLDPWRANAFDVSYERYLSNKAYMGAAFFYKDLKSYIYQQTDQTFDFSKYTAGIPSCATVPTPPVCVSTTIGSNTQALNGQGGQLHGVELSGALPGELLASFLDGFGAVVSVSFNDSQITIKDKSLGGSNAPLPGLSKTVANVTVYYEKHGFSARAAMRARSNYLGEISDFAGERAFKYIKGDRILDVQAGYEFGQGLLQGWSVLFQVNNLTNEPYIAYQESETRVTDYQRYGRQLFAGFNFKM